MHIHMSTHSTYIYTHAHTHASSPSWGGQLAWQWTSSYDILPWHKPKTWTEICVAKCASYLAWVFALERESWVPQWPMKAKERKWLERVEMEGDIWTETCNKDWSHALLQRAPPGSWTTLWQGGFSQVWGIRDKWGWGGVMEIRKIMCPRWWRLHLSSSGPQMEKAHACHSVWGLIPHSNWGMVTSCFWEQLRSKGSEKRPSGDFSPRPF